jgi:hypothetical protein
MRSKTAIHCFLSSLQALQLSYSNGGLDWASTPATTTSKRVFKLPLPRPRSVSSDSHYHDLEARLWTPATTTYSYVAFLFSKTSLLDFCDCF